MNNEIKKLFWDIDENKQNLLQDDFIIKRVLIYGGLSSLIYIIKNYDIGKIKTVLFSLKKSEIEEKKSVFFKEYLFV